MTKIANITLKNGNNMAVYYDRKATSNPYILKEDYVTVEHYGQGPHDWRYVPHTRTVAKYANLSSATAYIHNYVILHDEERR